MDLILCEKNEAVDYEILQGLSSKCTSMARKWVISETMYTIDFPSDTEWYHGLKIWKTPHHLAQHNFSVKISQCSGLISIWN